jgi:hypothetical protein
MEEDIVLKYKKDIYASDMYIGLPHLTGVVCVWKCPFYPNICVYWDTVRFFNITTLPQFRKLLLC